MSTEANQRRTDTNLLVGDSRRAYLDLGWQHTLDFDSIALKMLRFDMELLENPGLSWRAEVDVKE